MTLVKSLQSLLEMYLYLAYEGTEADGSLKVSVIDLTAVRDFQTAHQIAASLSWVSGKELRATGNISTGTAYDRYYDSFTLIVKQ